MSTSGADVKRRPVTGTQVDVEEIETTRSEKLLALVLTVFLLVGGLWLYFNIDDIPSQPSYDGQLYGAQFGSETDRAAIREHETANRSLRQARRSEQSARRNLELRREAYRTALDAGEPSAGLRQRYDGAQSAFANAQRGRQQAAAAVAATRPAGLAAERRIEARGERAQQQFEDQRRDHDRNTFLLRLLYVLATAAAGYWLLKRVRTRRPRFLSLALAFVAFAAIQVIVMASDYSSDYVDYRDAGLLTLSLAGIAMTFAAFIALQGYLAQRVPQRRVRKRECPFCGYPVRENERCEGCGRTVLGECAVCGNRRRVGTAYCGTCGAT